MPWRTSLGLWFTGFAILLTFILSMIGWWVSLEMRKSERYNALSHRVYELGHRITVLEVYHNVQENEQERQEEQKQPPSLDEEKINE